jgi:ketosteroid isomerase-like protein
MKLLKSLTVLFMLFIVIACTNQTNEEDIIKKNITSYLAAIESGTISEMIKYADDVRFPNKQDQKNEYENIQDDISETSLEKLVKITETEYHAIIKYKQDNREDSTEITFPVIKKDDGWKIIVGEDIK